MGWRTEEFGASHEGWAGALLADGSEPGPVYLDAGSGPRMEKTTEWWAYDGRLPSTPRAAWARAACACGWRGEQRYPLDWERWRSRAGFDDSAARKEWSRHIREVERRSVPLPVGLTERLEQLGDELLALADQAPLAAVRAVAELERITVDVGHLAARNIHADEIPWEAAGEALGLSEREARSRIIRYSLRR
ncbi:hypothetical protein [Streptomyces sp. 891-h]|uniref:hypothetical protein n=1 Tax=unclassified Streptomyces TaxID=2593676 RepID=UPI001FAAB3FD|nr:hypothetical protein [Streptomyces sp. 891-h]UNZ20228.1 hypothetical protein HC362_27420 [Streptomyces sp. 891-h]